LDVAATLDSLLMSLLVTVLRLAIVTNSTTTKLEAVSLAVELFHHALVESTSASEDTP
jgi:hypothetical protein